MPNDFKNANPSDSSFGVKDKLGYVVSRRLNKSLSESMIFEKKYLLND